LIRTRTRSRNRLLSFEYEYEHENRPAYAGLSTISSLEALYSLAVVFLHKVMWARI